MCKTIAPAEQNRVVEIEVVDPGQRACQSFLDVDVRSLMVGRVS
jgi:hypothetical protein